ncbi:MAG TPA: ATP-binding protein [Bryobacteraceae bacterium]|nr:ATP-binding protein [Bryobacteraceae bacterium]
MDRHFERLTLPAHLNSLHPLVEFVRAGAESAGLGPDELDKLDLILEELLVNIARYAYQPASGVVEVAYAADGPGVLLVEISDSGRIFNPLKNEAADLSGGLADRPVGGLGVFLVRWLADSITYRREQGRNMVSFRFPGPKVAGT